MFLFKAEHHVFRDHHVYRPEDFEFSDGRPIVMTEKDAVKCEHFADERFWFVPIEVELPEVFETRLKTLLKRILNGQETLQGKLKSQRGGGTKILV